MRLFLGCVFGGSSVKCIDLRDEQQLPTVLKEFDGEAGRKSRQLSFNRRIKWRFGLLLTSGVFIDSFLERSSFFFGYALLD